MFGGWAWLLNGNLVCGAREDGMLARLGKGRDGWALALAGHRPDDLARTGDVGLGARGTPAYGDDALRQRLLSAALEFVRSLPGK